MTTIFEQNWLFNDKIALHYSGLRVIALLIKNLTKIRFSKKIGKFFKGTVHKEQMEGKTEEPGF